MRRLVTRALLLGLLASSLLFAPSASAALVAVVQFSPSQAPTLVFDAQPGEPNVAGAEFAPGGQVTVVDLGAPVQAGQGCTEAPPTSVKCSAPGLRGATFALGDNDDTLKLVWSDTVPSAARRVRRCGGPIRIFDGSGNDTIAGSRAGEHFMNDAGDDIFRGGRGQDQFDGGDGADVFSGGRNEDTLCYRGRSEGVSVDLDGRPDDGQEVEGDLAGRDLENLVGGDGNDRLVGDTGRNKLSGGRGRDRLRGGRRTDVLRGGRGRDRLFGGSGPDRLIGGPGNDVFFGGPGRDRIG